MSKSHIKTLTVAIRAEALKETLEFLCRAETDKEIGRRAMLLAFILTPEIFDGKQGVLAKRMGLSRPRVTQMLTATKRGMRGMASKSAGNSLHGLTAFTG